MHQATDLAKATSAMVYAEPESLGVLARLLVAVKPSVIRQSPGPVPLEALLLSAAYPRQEPRGGGEGLWSAMA